MGRGKVQSDSGSDLIIAHGHDARGPFGIDVKCLLHWHPHRHPICKGCRRIGLNQPPGLNRQLGRLRPVRHNADDAGVEAHGIAGHDRPANPRPATDRHINSVQIRLRAEQLMGIGGDTAHQFRVIGRHKEQALRFGHSDRFKPGGIEIVAMLDQLGTKGPHGGILFHRIATRHKDFGGQPGPGCGPGLALPVIAARGCTNTRNIWMGTG
mmetsp:Transcript_28313/g.52734  ORF Transcript_28313/g.52734 Transcript_28313/m.52734 type:complete len:210 (-) Transcript_28313:3221-3850(-)